ncbi:MAG TPA: MEDS domain-containing protein [Burkholderiales bacterium]
MNAATGWRPLLGQATLREHIAQVYQDEHFLADVVSEYVAGALRHGQAALLITTAAHRRLFEAALGAAGVDMAAAAARRQVVFLDAERMLEELMHGGMPEARAFRGGLGDAVTALGLQYPAVRAYGEMVDLLWQQERRDAAACLEQHWNDLLGVQAFSLLCAYRIDNLDAGSYGGPLERVCQAHTHLIPARDYARFDDAVAQAARDALDEPLSQMLLALAASSRPGADMPLGQAALLWLKKNMPLTADKVLAGARARC